MSKELALVKTTREYLLADEMIERFEAVLGRGAVPYVQSVILQVALSPKLQKCSLESVAQAAMEAAILRLSVLPQMKQAHIVPFRRGRLGYVAEMVVGYRGLSLLIERSGLYIAPPNVVAIYEGEEVYEDLVTGVHSLLLNGSNSKTRARRVTSPNRQRVVGWLGFVQRKGDVYPRSVYMSVEEIEAHAREYSKAYQADIQNGWKNSAWSAPAGSHERQIMEMKTVLRRLADWSEKSGRSDFEQAQAMLGEDVVDGEIVVPSLSERVARDEREETVRFDELFAPPTSDDVGYRYMSAEAVKVFVDEAGLPASQALQKLKRLHEDGVIGAYEPLSRLRVVARKQKAVIG